MKLSRVSVAAVGPVALTLATPTSAPAAPVVSDPIVTGLPGPLQIDLGDHGKIYVAQSFAGTLTKVRRDGTTEDLLSEPGGEARSRGVAAGAYGVAYTTTFFDRGHPQALLKLRRHNGPVVKVADLWTFEKRNNPDAADDVRLPRPHRRVRCPGGRPRRRPRRGRRERLSRTRESSTRTPTPWPTHRAAAGTSPTPAPTRSCTCPRAGRIAWSRVLPPAEDQGDGRRRPPPSGMPACTVGKTYAFEPVPTDVEVAGSGRLIVSLLPGGPEDESLGARGAVYQIKTAGEAHQHGRVHHR